MLLLAAVATATAVASILRTVVAAIGRAPPTCEHAICHPRTHLGDVLPRALVKCRILFSVFDPVRASSHVFLEWRYIDAEHGPAAATTAATGETSTTIVATTVLDTNSPSLNQKYALFDKENITVRRDM